MNKLDRAEPMIVLPVTPGSHIRLNDGQFAILTPHQQLWMTSSGNFYHPNEVDVIGATALYDAAGDA